MMAAIAGLIPAAGGPADAAAGAHRGERAVAERAAARARWAPRRTRSTLDADQPTVAIVGYPNVGKSTLFNRLAGRRDAVVDAVAGVTRDRRQAGAEWNGRAFQLIDTGGIDEADPSDVGKQIAAQAVRGIEEADLVLFVVNVQTAPTAGDLEVLDRLRRIGRPMMLVANKADSAGPEAAAQNLRSLGRRRGPRGLGAARAGDRRPPGRARRRAPRGPGRGRRAGAGPGHLHHRAPQRRQELDPERPARRGPRRGARRPRAPPATPSTRSSRSTAGPSS